MRRTRRRLSIGALFTPAVILVILGAMAMAREWPRPAQLVPLTAGAIALAVCSLNWINELFGAPDNAPEGQEAEAAALADTLPNRVVQGRAIVFFLWLGGFVALVALIGFLPAIVVFVVANMTLAYGKGLRASAASAVIVGVFCWLVFHVLLQVAWPDSVLGDLVPNLRTATGFL
jgi:putative tricarboxylic transport membrane protein